MQSSFNFQKHKMPPKRITTQGSSRPPDVAYHIISLQGNVHKSFIQNALIAECCRRYSNREYQWKLIKYLNPAFMILTVCILVAGISESTGSVQ